MKVHALIATAALTLAPHVARASVVNQWLSNAAVALTTDATTGNETVYVTTRLTSSAGLIPVTLPIPNPKNPAQMIGSVALVANPTGGYGLQIVIDVTAALKLKPAGLGLLPNGTLIPLAGPNPLQWVTLALPNKLGQVYLNLNTPSKTAVVGAALNVAALGTGFPMNILLPFKATKASGIAGVYTGAKGQGGFGVFVDATSLLAK